MRRNRARDYLDVAALADHVGVGEAAAVLVQMDEYYADQHAGGDGVASQVARQLADPRPADPSVIRELHRYRHLAERWQDWTTVTAACRRLAAAMVERGPDRPEAGPAGT